MIPPWKEARNEFSHEDNGILQTFFDVYINQEVDDFVKQKLEEWDFAMATTKMNKEHFRFYGFRNIFNEHHLQNGNHYP